jgi:hypothetical protein
MNRYNLIKGILNETDLIKLPESEIRQITDSKLVPYIRKEIIPNMTEDVVPYNKAYFPQEMWDLFKLPFEGHMINISTGFYYDPKDKAIARMDVYNAHLLLNMNRLNVSDMATIIIHEMTHAIDPKIHKMDVSRKLDTKYDERDERDDEKQDEKKSDEENAKNAAKVFARYQKGPREFDSHTGEVIRTLKNNFDLLPDKDYGDYQIDLWKILIEASNNNGNQLYNAHKEDAIKYLFTDKWFDHMEAKTVIDTNFWRWLSIIAIWATKPSLYKRFYNRLAKYVPYKA